METIKADEELENKVRQVPAAVQTQERQSGAERHGAERPQPVEAFFQEEEQLPKGTKAEVMRNM